MPTINQLTSVDTVVASDQFPIYSSANGDARKSSMTTLVNFLQTSDINKFQQNGTGALIRTTPDRERDTFHTTDYDTLANAKFAAGNAPVFDPVGITHKDVFNNQTNLYAESGETTWLSATVQRSADNTGAHPGIGKTVHTIESRPIGSGVNGPTSADYGMHISCVKQNWMTTTVAGEVDGINIVVRNGGGNDSDSAGVMVNNGIVGGSFSAAMENQSSLINSSGTVLKQISTQIGVINELNTTGIGFFTKMNSGTGAKAIQAGYVTGSSFWTHLLSLENSLYQLFAVDGSGVVQVANATNGQRKLIRTNTLGALEFVNNANSAVIATLSDVGALNLISGANYAINNTQVVGSRVTGWGAVTGAISRSAFDAGTATAAQVAQTVGALITDLKVHGLIGT